jgi:hypothetical protein
MSYLEYELRVIQRYKLFIHKQLTDNKFKPCREVNALKEDWEYLNKREQVILNEVEKGRG